MLKLNGFLLFLMMAFSVQAQQAPGGQRDSSERVVPTPRPGAGRATPNANAPKPYREVITDKAITDEGVFTVHRVDERYFFEIPDALLGRDVLIVNRVARAPEEIRELYGSDQIGEIVVRFEKGKNDKIFLRRVLHVERADSIETGMYRSVSNSSLPAILASFAVKAYGGDSLGVKTSVIDMTDFVQGENEVLHFSASNKRNVGGFQGDKSYIESIKSYPINIEIRTVRTYGRGAGTPRPGMPAAAAAPASALPITFEMNSSLVLLPETPMKPRYADARVGYFTQSFNKFEDNAVEAKAYIARWKLEPKDKARYARGELTEPVKPIVFYIDPATPKKWVPYLIQGVNDWQVAFEAAGFKNAIYALEAPANDSTWSINDALHSVIVYKSSTIANASGPHVHDPRSGEIIETHINWYHNIQELLHNWYMIQVSMVDPAARKMKFDDELMGQLIRFVSSHEVGHTLGLRHNYGSSSTVPVEKLRDKSWVEKNGHTPSIMDYARFNYVAQAGDKIGRAGLFPRIGDYDKWAIEWGYKWLPQFATPDDEIPHLNQWIIQRLQNPRLFFGHEMDASDPRSQSEDLGDDPVLASRYGIQNLKAILPQLPQWTREENKNYGGLQKMYGEVIGQYGRYMGHVAKVIGGKYNTPRTVEEAGLVHVPVPVEKQKEALKFLIDNLFQVPVWLLDESIIPNINIDPVSLVGTNQASVLSRLQNPTILMNIIRDKQYDLFEYLDDLKQGVWTELYTNQPVDLLRRNLQRAYVANCTKELTVTPPTGNTVPFSAPNQSQNDAAGIYRSHLTELLGDVVHAAGKTSDRMTLAHLRDIQKRIEKALEPAR
ncbi:MAG: zinc-dependent metalloprotease [Odoribacteraceae bacterium]|jgi:hypothetical protein|nr:zinc-dependent metalloprotease [Odoribacteraceae bacterium]